MPTDLSRFNDFLSSIDLDSLGKEYRPIKIVELDMPKEVQALACIYKEYWDKRNSWVGYKEFYEIYKNSLHSELEEWRKKCQFSEETFYLGLPARIYRTWASLLTQIQGAYVAEEIYGKGEVEMGVGIDQSGKDLVITLPLPEKPRLPVQIKKLSGRLEARRKGNPKHSYIQIVYAVPPSGEYTPTGKKSKPYHDWKQKWGDRLDRLDNGFVIFKPEMFKLSNLLKGIIEKASEDNLPGGLIEEVIDD